MSARSYYEVLGVSRGASPDEIKRAYRIEAARAHPDVNPGDAKAVMRAREVTEAYRVLGDPDRKTEYDEMGSPPERVAEFFMRVPAADRSLFCNLGRAPKDARPGPHMVMVVEVEPAVLREGGIIEVPHVDDSGLKGTFRVKVPPGAYETPWCRVRGAGALGSENAYEEYPDGTPGDLFLLLTSN